MQCPRCNMDNDDARAACWNCFAQLKPSMASKPVVIKFQKQETKEVELTSPSPTQSPEEAVVASSPPVEHPHAKPEVEIATDSSAQEVEEIPVADTGQSLDLDVGGSSTEYVAETSDIDFLSTEPLPETGSVDASETSDQFTLDEGKSATWDRTFDIEDEPVSTSDLVIPGLAYSQPGGDDEISFDLDELITDSGEADLGKSKEGESSDEADEEGLG